MAFTFTREERLCNKAIIARLFEKGNRGFAQFPFRFIWVEARLPENVPLQVLFTVAKRSFPSAVHRNRIKRQLRELYRLRKGRLYDCLQAKNKTFALLVSYTGKEKMAFAELEKSFRAAMLRLLTEFEKDPPVSVPPADQAL